MNKIIKYTELREFCAQNGRVVAHLNDISKGTFRSFHCADSQHDNSKTIDFSNKMSDGVNSLAGILSMHGYVVEFENIDHYILCSELELHDLLIMQEIFEKSQKEKVNPEHFKDLNCLSDFWDFSNKAYEKCSEYKGLLDSFDFSIDIHEESSPCHFECIFPLCPFYCDFTLKAKKYHPADYDEYINSDLATELIDKH